VAEILAAAKWADKKFERVWKIGLAKIVGSFTTNDLKETELFVSDISFTDSL
jgi:hypothetical protein